MACAEPSLALFRDHLEYRVVHLITVRNGHLMLLTQDKRSQPRITSVALPGRCIGRLPYSTRVSAVDTVTWRYADDRILTARCPP